MNPFNLLEKAINEHGSSVILKEHLALVKEMLAKVEQERADLIAKCSELEKELGDIRQQLNEKNIPEEFTEYLGALFKRDSSGNYIPMAHCRQCKQPLWNNEPEFFPYECSNKVCGYTIMIHEDLHFIASKLQNTSS